MGTESNPQFLINYPCQPIPKFLDDIYVIKLAYHTFESVVSTAFHRNRRDFSEHFLHHVMTLALVSYSYFTNFLPVGSVIMLIMDFTDIFVALFKMAADVNDFWQNILFSLMFTGWCSLRIFFFPVYVIYPFY